MSRELGDLLEQTARGPCDRDLDPADIAVKARRQRRWGAVAAAVVVLAALVGGAAWVRSLAAAPQAPFVESSPPTSVPAGWETVHVGRAALSVPSDWAIHRLDSDRSLPCLPFAEPAIWVGSPGTPSSCVAPPASEPPRHVGIIATPMVLLGGNDPDARSVVIDGHEGSWVQVGDGERQYRFPTLEVMLTVSYEPDPQLAQQVLSTLRRSEGSTVEPTPIRPSVADRPSEIDPGPALTADGLPAMGPEGVAVQAPAGVVFVGIDGTVHGHLPGAELGLGDPAQHVPGAIPLYVPAADDDLLDRLWLQPASGATVPQGLLVAPLQHNYRIVEIPTSTDPSPVVLEALTDDGRQRIARFPPNNQGRVSAGHRVASWRECPDDAGRDLSRCDWLAFDTDSGERLRLDPGCRVSDSSADHTHAIVCSQGWIEGDGTSWIERRGPGQATSRIPAPRDDGQPDDPASAGRYLNAFLDGDNIVTTWRTRCEPSTRVPPAAERDSAVVATDEGQLRPLIGDDLTTTPAARVLGITQDGHAVVHVLSAPGCGQAGHPGIHLLDPDTGDTSPVVAGSVEAAEMWISEPSLDHD